MPSLAIVVLEEVSRVVSGNVDHMHSSSWDGANAESAKVMRAGGVTETECV